jgi:hypothetical protein
MCEISSSNTIDTSNEGMKNRKRVAVGRSSHSEVAAQETLPLGTFSNKESGSLETHEALPDTIGEDEHRGY